MNKTKWEPRPLQLRGLKLLMEESGARLFIRPGHGKTAIVLKSFDILRRKGLVDTLLVIAPLRVIMTSWPSELTKWTDFEGLTYETIHGGQRERRAAMEAKADIYLMNCEGLLSPEWAYDPKVPNKYALDWIRQRKIMLVVDESTRFANGASQRFKALRSYLPHFERRVILTGTPRRGKLEDLWSQCYITDCGEDLGRFVSHFRNMYMMRSRYGFGFEELPGAAQRVADRIVKTTLLSSPEDSDMPILEVEVTVPMSKELRAKYNELKTEFLTQLGDSTIMAPNAGVLWGKLRQFCSGAIYINNCSEWVTVHDGKLDALQNLLEELGGEPAFCLYSYAHDYERINERLGREVPRVGGGVSASKGTAACRLFSAGQLPLLMGHPQSVALGVDGLQNNCSNIIWFGGDPSWESTYQANLRIARPGSRAEQVTIYRIMLDCDVERAILKKSRNKELSEAEFLNMLREGES